MSKKISSCQIQQGCFWAMHDLNNCCQALCHYSWYHWLQSIVVLYLVVVIWIVWNRMPKSTRNSGGFASTYQLDLWRKPIFFVIFCQDFGHNLQIEVNKNLSTYFYNFGYLIHHYSLRNYSCSIWYFSLQIY